MAPAERAEKPVAYEAVVVRHSYDAGAEEFVNVGVLLAVPGLKFYGARFIPSWTRVSGMFPQADLGQLRRLAAAMESKLQTWTAQQRSELPLFDPPTLRATLGQILGSEEPGFKASALIQGRTSSPEATLAEIYEHHIGRFIPQVEVVTRSDQDIWRAFVQALPSPTLSQLFRPFIVRGPNLEHEFAYSFRDSVLNLVQPLSFDMSEAGRVRDKATAWVGRALSLRLSQQNIQLHLLLGMPDASRPKEVRDAASDARLILKHGLEQDVTVWDEGKTKKLVEKIRALPAT